MNIECNPHRNISTRCLYYNGSWHDICMSCGMVDDIGGPAGGGGIMITSWIKYDQIGVEAKNRPDMIQRESGIWVPNNEPEQADQDRS